MNNKIIKHNLVSKIKLFTLLVFTTASFLIFYSKAFAFTEPPYIPVNKHTAVDGNNMVTSCSGTQYYVDDDCASGGTGTANQANGVCSGATRAFATLAAAQSAMVAGDCVKIHAGTYIYNSGFQWSKSGTPSHETIIEAYGDGDAIMEMHGTTNGSQFSVSGTYIIFDGGSNRQLIFNGENETAGTVALNPSNTTTHITLSRILAKNNGGIWYVYPNDLRCNWSNVGISGTGDYLKVYNSEVSGCCGAGIYSGSGDHQEYRNNLIHDNKGTGLQINTHGGFSSTDITIAGNAIYNNGLGGVTGQNRPGIAILSAQNILYDVYVYNNLLWGNQSAGIGVGGDSNIRARIYNNTILNNPIWGLTITGNNVDIQNNIMRNNGTGIWSSADFDIATYNVTLNTVTLKNNIIGIYGQTHLDYSSLKPGNINTDPQFLSTDPNNSNYLKLSPSGPAINVGATISLVTTDFFGTSRPQGTAYDIGAYEYPSGGSGDITPPSAPTGVTVS